MSEQIRPEQNNVVQLNPERAAGQPPQIILARLPAAMHSLREAEGIAQGHFCRLARVSRIVRIAFTHKVRPLES